MGSLKTLFDWLKPAPRRGFMLRDFMAEVEHVESLGPPSKWLELIPSIRKLKLDEQDLSKQMDVMRPIYCSMTAAERDDPDCLNGSRRSRIATGAGVHTRDVAQFQRQFEMSREIHQRIQGRG